MENLIEENNTMIAEFMELEVTPKYNPKEYYVKEYNSGEWYLPEEMKYHESWDWLMLVVEKIETEHKTNFKIRCYWNEFNQCPYYQVSVNIKEGTMSKDRACIYDSRKVYEHITDVNKCKKESFYFFFK